MSRSRSDRQKIKGEIHGRHSFKVVGDRIIDACGGERVGSPARKKDAKREAVRMRRRNWSPEALNYAEEDLR